MKNREQNPTDACFVWTFAPLCIIVLQKLICHWILKVIVFSASPSSMCAFHFPYENKVRLKLYWGDISIFNPSEVEAFCRRKGRRRENTKQGDKIHLKGEKLLGKISSLRSYFMYGISASMQYASHHPQQCSHIHFSW